MGIVYLPKIKELKKYENTNVDKILFHIAVNNNLINNNKVMYRKLYHNILYPWFKKNCNTRLSYKQYVKLRKNYNGRIPKHEASYLYELYRIMLSIDSVLGDHENDRRTYSGYTLFFEKKQVEYTIIALENHITVNNEQINELRYFKTSLSDLDNRISEENNRKIFNGIW